MKDDAFAATWYVFWILPIIFLGLNLFIMPRNPGILDHLEEVQGNIPAGDPGLCENAVVDSVAGYFAPLYRENGIPLSFSLDLPRNLPAPDSGLCSVLSNLLENAMEASLRTAPEKHSVRVSARLRSGNMLLLSAKNSYDGKVREKMAVTADSTFAVGYLLPM